MTRPVGARSAGPWKTGGTFGRLRTRQAELTASGRDRNGADADRKTAVRIHLRSRMIHARRVGDSGIGESWRRGIADRGAGDVGIYGRKSSTSTGFETMASGSYNADSITVLEGLEAVRRRPGMYIGGVDKSGLHHLVWEIVDNAVDEVMNGHASRIVVTLEADGKTMSVADNGRGIPVDVHPKTGKSALEVIFTTLHAGGKFDNDAYKVAGGLHGVGASVVNALSKSLDRRRSAATGSRTPSSYRRGKPVGPVEPGEPSRGTGTTVTFTPDPEIFLDVEYDEKLIAERLDVKTYLNKGLVIQFVDKKHDTTSSSATTAASPTSSTP